VSGLDAKELLINSTDGLASLADGVETKLADLTADWRLTAADGPFVVALLPGKQQGRVFRLEAGRSEASSVLGPLPADDILLWAEAGRALVRTQDRLVMTDLANGAPLWTAPLGGSRLAALSGDRSTVTAVGGDAVYRLDVRTGRILSSSPAELAKDGPLAIAPSGEELACLDAGRHPALLDIGRGTATPIADELPATAFAWSRDSKILLVGHGDGSLAAYEIGKGLRWTIASPLEGTVKGTPLPNQPPQGTVLQIAVAREGGRFAVIRQDVPQIDIHELSDGRTLTALSPPSNIDPVPVTVSFEPGDVIVSSWTLHVMTRQTPLYVMAHLLPKDFDEALATAEARLAVYTKPWSPSGPPQATEAK
jgi:hypothetical protein